MYLEIGECRCGAGSMGVEVLLSALLDSFIRTVHTASRTNALSQRHELLLECPCDAPRLRTVSACVFNIQYTTSAHPMRSSALATTINHA